MASLVIYLVVFCLSGLFFSLGDKNKFSKYTILAVILPTILGGIRYGVGADFFSYSAKLQVSESMGFLQFFKTFNKMEPAVWIIGRFSGLLNANPTLFFTLTSFLVILMFYLGARRLNLKYIGLFMFLVMCVIFPQSLSGVRQGVAMAFSFYAITYIFDKNFKKFFLFIVAASMFHFSALAVLMVYPLFILFIDKTTPIKYQKNVIFLTISLPLLIFVSMNLIDGIPLLSKYAQYQNDIFIDKFQGKIGTHNFIPEIIAVTIAFIFYKRLVIVSNLGKLSFMMIIMMIYFNMLGLNFSLASRFADYFMPFFLIILTGVVGEFATKKDKKWASLTVVLFGVLFFIGAFYLNKSGSIFPYNFRI